MNYLKQLVNPVRSLIESWHSVDRIRISPCEGRLLRLAVGDKFLLFDSLFTVQKRRVESRGDGYSVVCALCRSVGDSARLLIHTTSGNSMTAQLQDGDSEEVVFDTDVTLLSHNHELED